MATLNFHITEIRRQLERKPALTSALIAALVGSLGLGLAACVKDYHSFIALGPGGIPSTIWGWLIVSLVIRPFGLREKDVRWTGDYPDYGASADILALPMRLGDLPMIGGIIPHRQLSQKGSEEMKTRLRETMDDMAKQNPDILEIKLSHFEKHNDALWVNSVLLNDQNTTLHETCRAAKGEIGHVHPDSSMHFSLGPADAKVIIEKKWGQRHRLARQQPWYLGWKKNMFGIPPTYIMVYAPRNEEEFEVFKTILKATVHYMTGKKDLKGF